MSNPSMAPKYLSQQEATSLDNKLFYECKLGVDRLMELAGFHVAQLIARTYPFQQYPRPLVCCGPGNNGGDGLVCARHLKVFGYSPKVIVPKIGKTSMYEELIAQCENFDLDLWIENDNALEHLEGDLIIDAIFGFSYKPPNRNVSIAKLLNSMFCRAATGVPLVSVDIPSGWEVDNGFENIESHNSSLNPDLRIPTLKPDCLISLTAPKLCARHFTGRYHYLAGRFCPKHLQIEYKLNLPEFPPSESIILLNKNESEQV